VDHSPDNLWVLCDVHHRHKFVGIHAITYPIWGPQDLVNSTMIGKMLDAASAELQDDRRTGHSGAPKKGTPSGDNPPPPHAAAHRKAHS
jgi:hypothetical protein